MGRSRLPQPNKQDELLRFLCVLIMFTTHTRMKMDNRMHWISTPQAGNGDVLSANPLIKTFTYLKLVSKLSHKTSLELLLDSMDVLKFWFLFFNTTKKAPFTIHITTTKRKFQDRNEENNYLVQRTSWCGDPWQRWHCVHSLPKSCSRSPTGMQNGNHCKCCAIKVFVNTEEWTSRGILKSPDMNLSGHQNPEAASTLSHNISLHQALGWCGS